MVESIEFKKYSNSRLVFLDFIRGIAALAVFFEHACDALWPEFRNFTHNSFSLGKFGVVIFFLTSGFIIPFSLERGESAIRFWIGRFFRLYPLYWTSLAFFLTLYAIGLSSAVAEDFRANIVRNSLVNITMFQEFFGVQSANGLYSTLSLELLFYITCTILFLFKLHRKSYLWAWVALGLTIIGSVLVPLELGRRLPMAAIFYILSMFVGTVLYRYSLKVITKRQVVQLLLAVCCVAAAGIYINYVLYKKADSTELFTFPAVMAPWTTGYIFFLGVFTLRNRIFPQFFSWLGKISYSVYLMHPTLLILKPNFLPRPLSLAVMLAATLILASITFHFIEQPLIGFGRQLQKKIIAPDTRTSSYL